MNLPEWSMRNRTVVLTGTLLLTVAGLAVFSNVPVDFDPSFEFRTAAVVTSWPGTEVKKVEELVTYPVEEIVSSIEEVKKVVSTTQVGLSVVEVTLENGVTDVGAAWDKIRAEVAKVSVPADQGCGRPVFDSTLGDIAVLMLAVYQLPESAAEHPYSLRELEVIAERMRDSIRLIPSVAEASLYGARQEAIFLEADVLGWSQLGVTVAELQSRLVAQNIVASGGALDLSESRIDVHPSGDLDAVDELHRLVIRTDAGGTPIYLRDLGVNVIRGYRDPPSVITRFSTADDSPGAPRQATAMPAVAIAIEMKKGRNVVDLGKEIRERIAIAKASILPADVDIATVVDRPTLVDTTIKDFVLSLIEAILIVLLVAFLMLGFRMALVMAMAIPVVMLSTIVLMRFWDIELQQISIGSLIIALGLLVDNAIEVCENVHRLLHEGYSRFDAAVEGSKQIAFPMLIATGTTIAAFLPMAFALEGVIGEYTFSLPMVVSICLASSWLLAMTFTTVLAYWLLRHSSAVSPLGYTVGLVKRLLPGPLRRLRFADVYTFACGTAIRVKWLTLLLAVGSFLFGVWMLASGKVSSVFFPAAARDQFVVEVYTPEGSPIGLTDKKCKRVEELILELRNAPDEDGNSRNRLRNMLTFVGDGGPRFESVFIPERPAAPHYGLVIVKCTDYEMVDQFVEDIRLAATARIPGARVVPHTYGLGEPIPHPITVRVHGTGFADINRLRGVARQVEDVIRSSGRTWNVTNRWGEPGLQLAVNVDAEQANRSGVTNINVAQTLNAYLSGQYLTTFREGEHQVPVYFRVPAHQRTNLQEIDQMFVEGSSAKVPLDAVAKYELRGETTKIQRYNMDRMIEVVARPLPGQLATPVLTESIEPKLDELEKALPPGFRLEYGGEIEKTLETLPMIGNSGLISAVVILLLLVVHYNSLTKPWLVLFMLPLATAGAIVGLYIFDEPMGFMAQLGLLSLYGVVLNDAIVLIEFIEMTIERRVDSGQGVPEGSERSFCGLTKEAFRDCLIQGAQMRVTPIMLTTLTTVGGLIPLLFSGPMFRALAAGMMSGLIFATFMTLLVLPAAIAIFVENLRLAFVHAVENSEGSEH